MREDTKTLLVRVVISKELYEEAKALCGLSHKDMQEIIADWGASGLSNHVAHQDNWIED